MSSGGVGSGTGGNAAEMSGPTAHARTGGDTWAVADAGGNGRGNTYNGTDAERLMQSYESIFGPAGRDIKIDAQRHKRHQRWHLPDNLKGRNEYLTDRIDGLITDATSSPFTRNILPYVYLESPDQKIKWNVYSFDEGMASRVPYESAARVLTQSKTSHAGYAVRQGLAIVMEHNFLASAAGMANFQNQLKQLVGSIQLTNDLDVHVALLQAASYQRTIDEKYYSENTSLYDASKKYVDMFGIMQKIPNALDILIEDAKNHLKTWGSQPPTFLLCPSDLTAQLQMSPERTNYITNGPDGLKRLAEGPNLPSYRGLSIIHSQKFSLEPGRKPRNVLKRRVRVAEYYWIDLSTVTSYQLYNQKKDMLVTFDRTHAARASNLKFQIEHNALFSPATMQRFGGNHDAIYKSASSGYCLLLRPNIEHEMLTIIAGRGGTQELGATFWGQTELACYDDAQHGIWGMSYKYHERAIVTNERNLIRMFDVAFDGYSGGMDTDIVRLEDINTTFVNDTYGSTPRYDGKSMIAMHFPRYLYVPTIKNPLINLLRQMFVPQLVDKGNEYDYSAIPSSDVQQCSCLLKSIYDQFDNSKLMTFCQHLEDERRWATIQTYHPRDLEAERQLQRKLQQARDEIRDITNGWTDFLAKCIRDLTKIYQDTRPQEPRAELYARILQLVFKAFRGGHVETMGPSRAGEFLTFLLSGHGDINGEDFEKAFDIVLKIMLMDFGLPQEDEAGHIAVDILNLRHLPPNVDVVADAVADPNNAAGAVAAQPAQNVDPHDQVLTLVLCKLHGIEVQYRNRADPMHWNYFRNSVHQDPGEIRQFLGKYHRNGVGVEATNREQSEALAKDFISSRKSCKELEYNLHLLQKPPFEMPNPVILTTIMHVTSRNTVPDGPDGKSTCDKEDLHNFFEQYQRFILQDQSDFPQEAQDMQTVVHDFMQMYNALCSNLATVNPVLPASTYIQNNQTELPAVAYHGNLTMHKSNGVRDEVRCVGHLGNSFPGCACIREGKGMTNMHQSLPTAVHVM